MGVMVIPSLRKLEYLEKATECASEYVLLSQSHIGNLRQLSDQCHAAGKKVMINAELVGGLGNDKIAYQMLEKMYRVDAVIESSMAKINMMKNMKLETIWRVTFMDSLSVETALRSLKNVQCDMLELRPGSYALEYMDLFREEYDGKIIIGGFMNSEELVKQAEEKGAYAIASSTCSLW
ncbi:MAG: glycerol-3-phosphate responsive antiterminator [Lachnospiraceae bacterium]|nr:glycerol-3-phosphate responsive antiterminator [Lachnospiraceae bacterium]